MNLPSLSPALNLIFLFSQCICNWLELCYLNNDSCLKVISALFVEGLHKKTTCGSLGFVFEILNGINRVEIKASKYCVVTSCSVLNTELQISKGSKLWRK